MSRFLSEIQEKYTELVQVVKISISFNQLVFPVIFMKFNQFSHPMTYAMLFVNTVNTKTLVFVALHPFLSITFLIFKQFSIRKVF